MKKRKKINFQRPKRENPPRILYKYLDVIGAEKSLANCTVKYSSPKEVNDPFEFVNGGFVQIDEKMLQNLNKKYQEKYPEIPIKVDPINFVNKCDNDFEVKAKEKAREIMINSMKFLSFSSECNNILLWSHYCDSHKGIVIGYDAKCIPNLHKVRYLTEPPKLKFFQLIPEEQQINEFLQILSCKSQKWEYENEWRSFISNMMKQKGINFESGICDIIQSTVKEVIFGINCSVDDKERILQICFDKKYDCNFYQAECVDSYQMSLKKINC